MVVYLLVNWPSHGLDDRRQRLWRHSSISSSRRVPSRRFPSGTSSRQARLEPYLQCSWTARDHELGGVL